jgi:imidazolonepropionase-like amidohydrolase
MKRTMSTLSVAALFCLTGLAPVVAQEVPEPQTLITNVDVWDGTSDSVQKGVDVLVEGSKIKRIAARISAPGAEKVDGKGGTLIPGLMDTHQHIMLPEGGPTDYRNKFDPYMNAYQAGEAARLMLLRGFTTIRDLMGPSVSLAKAIDMGYTVGPRIFSSQGAIGCTSGHSDFRNYNDYHPNMVGAGWSDGFLASMGFAFLADGPSEVTRAVRETLRMGASQVKVMAGGGVASLYDPLESVGYSEEEFRAAVNAATDYDTYVAIHAYNSESVQRAIRAGVKDCVHGHLIDEETVKMMAESGMWLSGMSKPPGLMEIPWFTEENKRKGRIMLEGYDKVFPLAKKYGVKMAFGTDAAGSPEMMEMQLLEFEARSQFFTPVEMLRQATSNAGELLALANSRNPYRDATLGVVEEGAWADLLIYAKNPLDDIGVVVGYQENLKVVMKNGVIYKNELD